LAARITSPTLRLIAYPEIRPLAPFLAPGTLPPINFFGQNGPMVVKNDELGIQVSQTSGGASPISCGVWLNDDFRPAPQGLTTPILTTATIVAAANTWTAGPLTFSQQLPAGRYAVTGFDCQGDDLVFARLIFPNQATRPMVAGTVSATPEPWFQFRRGGMGLLGEFHTYAPPQLEVYGSAATASQICTMDIIRIGDS
jgi:hypothetical protein